jgi:hypothetical protein
VIPSLQKFTQKNKEKEFSKSEIPNVPFLPW